MPSRFNCRLSHGPSFCGLLALLCLPPALLLAGEEGFTELFNGKDLSGWVNVNCAPSTFTVQDGIIHSSGVPTGVMRTEKQYENFILELEWRHLVPGGNAGLFVWSDALPVRGQPFTRAIEVQILDGVNSENYTSHGDIFGIHGAAFTPDRPHPAGWARCLPSERRCRPAGEWNHYRITCENGAIQLAVNGKVVSGGTQSRPRKGYICLESEGGKVEYRNLRIRELPPGDAAAAGEAAPPAEPFRSLYTGVDLAGWRQDPGHAGHWRPRDWILEYDGKSEAADKSLWTEKEYGDFVLICDWRWTAQPVARKRPVILPSGDEATRSDGTVEEVEVLDAGDSGIYLRGSSKSQVNIWCWPVGSGEVYGYRTDRSQPPEVRAAVTPKRKADRPIGQWNRFVITLRGERLTVELNGEQVIEEARLPGIPARGRIALQHHGDPIQFANVYIRELP
jgi:hypothetical protein